MGRIVRALLPSVLLFAVLAPPPPAAASSECLSCVADFAIYDAAYEDDGVWEEEVVALKALLDAYGWTYQTVTPGQINSGALGSGDAKRFRALIAPGGWAAKRKGDVTDTGDANIRTFVSGGGNYVGFCAGSYWASKTVVFAGVATGGGGSYNQSSDYKSYDYDLKLFKGRAKGPFGWTPWDGGENASLEKVSVNTGNATMLAAAMPSSTRFFYYGGPFFTYDEKPSGWSVWAKAAMPNGTSDAASTGNGKPVVAKFSYGSGKVVLFSHHPEILIDSNVDGVVLSQYIDETAMTWNTGSNTQEQINIDSWNIVHAAFQVATGQTVTPLTKLPA